MLYLLSHCRRMRMAINNGSPDRLLGGGRYRPLSLIAGGDGGPPVEENTITRDALLFLSPLRIVCIIFLLFRPLSVTICRGMGDDHLKTDKVCYVSFGHFDF